MQLAFEPHSAYERTTVIQSLFGDGFIRYSMVDKPEHPSLHVLAIAEQVITDTEKCMQWHCADWGME